MCQVRRRRLTHQAVRRPRADRPHPGDRSPAKGPSRIDDKECDSLELLSLLKGTTLTKEMFLNHLYGGMDEPELKIIDVFVCKLRKKLTQAAGGEHYIETVWGRGYVLRDPTEVAPQLKSA